MANKSSNVRKRKDGRWEGRFKVGVYDDGRTKYKSVYARTYAEVKVKLSELSSVETNNAFSIGKPVLFADVLDMWLASVKIRLKGSTVLKYQNIITTHIKPELGGIKVSTITPLMINSFLEQKSNAG